ncbi:MAG TPA: integrase arm-type DNA-binding domain-containing protein [Candidatus Dormibacteraeota bacterium]|nr:integrase arm-type DNA-binding domain-containing protein [Candidatus Dormibacteraeota bacterium]
MLTERAIHNAKPASKIKRLYDAGGLYLEITPRGAKWWRLKYRFNGKEKRLALGVYGNVPLKEARLKRDGAKKLLSQGNDPGEVRKSQKIVRNATNTESIEIIAREWFAKFSPGWAPSHSGKILRRLKRDIFPWLGRRSIREVSASELLAVVRRIESRGALETAHRALQNCSQIFRYAVANGYAERDPSPDLRGALPPAKEKHHPSLTDAKAVGALLRAIHGYDGHLVTRCALKLAPLVFVRPGELRRAEWAEFNLESAEWRIPAEKMKSRAPHVVPLSRQALEVLRELKPLTGAGKYLFPSIRSASRPMSENTVNAALRRLGYTKDQMTGHGFRSMASTTLNEQGWNRDAIERQLAHGERDPVRAAYNYAEHLPERRKMMQAWADYLDGLRKGAEIVPFRKQST